MMRILLVNYEYPPVGAGAGTATQALARELSRAGHEVVVLTGSFAGLPKNFVDGKITVRRVACIRSSKDRCTILEMVSFLVSALLAVPRIIRRHKIQVSIVFFSFPCGPVGLLARWICGVPYIVSLRGGDVPGAEPQLSFVHKLLSPIRRLILNDSTAVVANSSGLKRMAEVADSYAVHLIPNGVDTSFFHPVTPPTVAATASQPFRILFVGRFQTQKNISLLFQEVAHLPTGSFELHLVGDGPLHEHLRELASEIGIADSIKWHGWLERDELREIYRSVDCLVNPSLYEGMPNAVLEAIASGKPVIASRVAGNETVVQHGVTGFLFALDEPVSLRESLSKLMSNRQHAVEMGERGRRWVEHEFSWTPVAAAYVKLFQSS
jgi:glycosyltransferase involved in cell wall biosynthesis